MSVGAGQPGAYALFETGIGRCAVVWRGSTIIGCFLPESGERRLRERIERRFPGVGEAAPPAGVQAAIDAAVALLSGQAAGIPPLDFDLGGLGAFDRRVLEAAAAIPIGETRTYGEIAAELGEPRAAQAVGRALGRNPIPILIPCHRVVAANGGSGGFSAPGGVATKLRILAIERARRGDQPGLFEALPWAVAPGRG